MTGDIKYAENALKLFSATDALVINTDRYQEDAPNMGRRAFEVRKRLG